MHDIKLPFPSTAKNALRRSFLEVCSQQTREIQEPIANPYATIGHPNPAGLGRAAETSRVGSWGQSSVLFMDLESYLYADATGKSPYGGAEYGITQTPEAAAVCAKIAALHHGFGAIICPSGLSAITTTIEAFSPKVVLIPDNVYAPLVRFLTRRNIQIVRYPAGVSALEFEDYFWRAQKGVSRSCDLLTYIEAPGSGSFEIPDIDGIVNISRRQGARTVMDNTWASHVRFKPLDHGVDIVIQATTKKVNHVVYSGAPIKAEVAGARRKAVSSINDLINASVLIESMPNRKGKQKPGIIGYHRFYVPVRIGGKNYTVRLVAEQTKDGFKTQSYDLYDAVMEGGKFAPPRADDESTLKAERAFSTTIREMLSGVKDANGNAYFQSAFHGSPYQFDRFTLDHIGTGEGAYEGGYGDTPSGIVIAKDSKDYQQLADELRATGNGAVAPTTCTRLYHRIDSTEERLIPRFSTKSLFRAFQRPIKTIRIFRHLSAKWILRNLKTLGKRTPELTIIPAASETAIAAAWNSAKCSRLPLIRSTP